MTQTKPGDRGRVGLAKLGVVSISATMALILTAALSLTALRSPTGLAASLAFTIASTSLLVAGLLVALDRTKAFALGFLIFGGGYAYLAFAPGARVEIQPHLVTSGLIKDLYDEMGHNRAGVKPPPFSQKFDAYTMFPNPGYGGPVYLSFQRIGHSSAVIAHGLFGGLLARLLAPRRRRGPTGDAI